MANINQPISGNHIKLLRNGAEYFPALLEAIAQSQSEIHLQTYIFEADAVGLAVADALKHAASRGVKVNLLLDGFGSKALPKSLVQDLDGAGIQVMFYRPKISPWSLKKNRLRRLHRKVAIIDQSIGFLGGINIIDDYNVPDQAPPRVDYAVKIEGPLVTALCRLTHSLWRKLSKLHLKKIATMHSCDQQPAMPEGMKASLVIRDNVLHRRDIENAYLNAIRQAQSDITIANAYFLPNKTFRDALIEASRRGVKVNLLLQGRVEYFYMFATRALYRLFLMHNINVYEYRKSFMHSKVAVIDQHWATVGSSNLDPFSLLLAHEANIVVNDTRFATDIWQDLQLAIGAGSVQITSTVLDQSHLGTRILSWMAYGIVRLFAQAFDHQPHSD